jgi:hypothetical protein
VAKAETTRKREVKAMIMATTWTQMRDLVIKTKITRLGLKNQSPLAVLAVRGSRPPDAEQPLCVEVDVGDFSLSLLDFRLSESECQAFSAS